MPSLSSRKKKKQTGSGETLTLDEVKTLGTDLLSSREHINNLPILLRVLSPSSPPHLILDSLLSLHSFFLTILPDVPARSCSHHGDGPQDVYSIWLRNRFDEFLNSLIAIAASPQPEDAILDLVVDVIMEFVKKGKDGKFESAIYHRFMHGLVFATSVSENLLKLLAEKFFKFADVRYYTYICMAKISGKCERLDTDESKAKFDVERTSDKYILEAGMEASVHCIYTILACISSLESVDRESALETWSETGFSLEGEEKSLGMSLLDGEPQKSNKIQGKVSKKLKAKLTKAWRSFLKLQLPLDVYKEVLGRLHQVVIPNVANPVFLCDFLTRSYDIGGVISVMALSGLFVLITEHGIEYPNYYTKLYALLTPTIFMAKYRARFFQLLDTSLKSGYLPAYLAAAFSKKLSRLALTVPPSGALVIIAIIHNLLRRHPSINFLVHQIAGGCTEEDGSTAGNEPVDGADEAVDGADEANHEPVMPSKTNGDDPFRMDESDPLKSDAMRSSLWEIDTLRHHYCPAVSRFVASLENDLTVRNKTSEVTVSDFASGSYATIFGAEIRRRIKQVPLAFYRVAPTTLFSESDFAGWSFGVEESVAEEDAGKKTINDLGVVEHQGSKRQRIECS